MKSNQIKIALRYIIFEQMVRPVGLKSNDEVCTGPDREVRSLLAGCLLGVRWRLES